MKFFSLSKDSGQSKQTVLFVCLENAGITQMAEGFFRKYAENYEPISTGTKPVSNINALVMDVMKEVDINISEQRPKIITEDMIRQSSVRINMGCIEKESCPTLFLHGLEHRGPKRQVNREAGCWIVYNYARLTEIRMEIMDLVEFLYKSKRARYIVHSNLSSDGFELYWIMESIFFPDHCPDLLLLCVWS